jgi:hypothetical protein
VGALGSMRRANRGKGPDPRDGTEKRRHASMGTS